MLNKDDFEQLDKLLTIVKRSDEYESVDIHYDKEEGWRVNVYPRSITLGEDYDGWVIKKKRLGSVCSDRIAWIVQKKLGG